MKQLRAGGGVALVGITLIPLLSGLFGYCLLYTSTIAIFTALFLLPINIAYEPVKIDFPFEVEEDVYKRQAPWVIVDKVVQFRLLRHGHIQCILNPGTAGRAGLDALRCV